MRLVLPAFFALVFSVLLTLLPNLPPGAQLSLRWLLVFATFAFFMESLFLWNRQRQTTRSASREREEEVNRQTQQANLAAAQSVSARLEQVDAELVQFLGVLQSRGRFVDFLMEDISRVSDAEVGAAARVVHQGCSAVLKEFFRVEPVVAEGEGSRVTIGPDGASFQYRLVGRVGAQPPYTGTILHRGWRTTKVALPRVSNVEASFGGKGVIAPAEIEV